ncbi:hypothetical protein SERLA73DRAFT_188718 [Serpula lacrymans var. lacrymans S7.3]|uniref:RTA1-domain-containing protein n=2 Tax=Serpula lacrymans var. lacrymans TaxID=341189 RepID=F8QC09_SERL3|nr:uncharacterized protein SERLADRAFT_479121 [Serpula lacrymans var. lacrymans S7.9]EGN94128.1 hypothetical protein SERLA73DRAFT_188718 [Serpula lacrymans var. lacrymans S7.3]EGO19562.1 hypothetical protein SERLADRAFT_479121 [Serpula lacrymans var. lacrymans S7.9]
MATAPPAIAPLREPYHYVPTEYVCAIFVVLYSISTLVHLFQCIRARLWWLLPTAVFAGVAEILGWSARLWSSKNPHILIPYEIQLTATILAPTPLVAANFIILGKIIGRLGSRYSRLSPKLYTFVFCSFDVICLIVQAVGGASAATAVGKQQSPNNGGNIMLGGIVAQMISITVYVACAGEFFLRYFSDSPLRRVFPVDSPNNAGGNVIDPNMKLMIMALIFETTCIFIRSVYRTIELANGFTGRIISTQVYFNVLDGAMITLAIFTLNIAHPAVLLKNPRVPNKTIVDQGQESDLEGKLEPNAM